MGVLANICVQFRQEDSQESSLIDINHPTPELEAPARELSPVLAPSPSPSTTSIYSRAAAINTNEWSSPAFIKRARTSYGSLFDGGYDPFAEADGSVPGRGRKRTRLSSTWRYSSRSPTPEPEESSIPSPPVSAPTLAPASAPTLKVADENSQTIQSDVGDAAETLAGLFKQPQTNGRYLPANVLSQPEITLSPPRTPHVESASSLMPPPTIQTQFHSINSSSLSASQPVDLESLPIAPDSPQLRPISSDLLLLVSPLVTSGAGLFTGQIQEPVRSFGSTGIELEPGTPLNESSDAAGISRTFDTNDSASRSSPTPIISQTLQDEEDLYGTSPISRHGERQVEVIDHHTNGFASINQANEGHIISENQYGQWETERASLGQNSLPHTANEFQGGLFTQEADRESRFQQDSNMNFTDSLQPSDASQTNQYPDPDAELQVSSFSNPYSLSRNQPGFGVEYPELPDDGEEMYTERQPQSTQKSRSQSNGSEAVDLTESEDDDPEQGEGLTNFPVDNDGFPEYSVDGSGESEDEEPYVREGPASSRYFIPDVDEREDSGWDQLNEGQQEELYSDDEDVENYDEDEEEGSYDEEDMSQDDEPAEKGPPVFIDLLSSDDEAAPEKSVKSSPQRARPSQQSDDDDEDEDVVDENDVNDSEGEFEDEMEAEDKKLLEQFEVESTTSRIDREESSEIAEDQGSLEREEQASETSEEQPQEEPLTPKGKITASAGEDESIGHVLSDTITEQGLTTEDEKATPQSFQEAPERSRPSLEANEQERGVDNSEPTPAISSPPVQKALKSHPEIFGQRLVPPPPFNPISNFDGASDSRTEFLYPSLSSFDSTSTSVSGFGQLSQSSSTSESQLFGRKTTQLPTPKDTQASQIKESQILFSFTTGIESISILSQGPASQSVIDPGLENISQPTNEVEELSEKQDGNTQEEGLESTGDKMELDTADNEPEDAQLPAVNNESESSIAEVEMELEEGNAVESGDADTDDIKTSRQKDEQIAQQDGLVDQETEIEVIGGEVEVIVEEVIVEEAASREVIVEETTIVKEVVVEEAAVEEGNVEEELAEDIVTRDDTIQKSDVVDSDRLDPIENSNEAPATVSTNGDAQAEAEASVEQDSLAVTSVDKQIEDDGVAHVSPRRSQRIGKSGPTETVETPAPVTPTRTTRTDIQQDPDTIVVSPPETDQETPHGHDASIELALSALDSPTTQLHDLRRAPIVDLKIRLSRVLRTELSEYTSLKVLRYHINQKLDILAIATTTTEEPQRNKGGPRHYQITFNITDPSIAPSAVTECVIHRPYKDALPTIKAGDGVLLRNFQVFSAKDKGFALRSEQTEASSWAVFKDDNEVEVRGPPVEYGPAESRYFSSLKEWFGSLDAVAAARLARANASKAK